MEIHHITIRAIAQATESEDRVKTALSLFLPDNDIEIISSEGHFGNPITIFQSSITGRKCRRFIDFLKTSLHGKDMGLLKNQITERVDEQCALHIRFDKQAAYEGIVQLATTPDTIAARIKIKAYPARREIAIKVAETLF
ncbi:MAG: exosome subunit [Candidatus Methanoperedens sp.]|jgi:hypothetical protein|nr:exosome subunit [Candidatus Methanoperedens sp.]PKL54785.1 MAG: hypothetical protein CVV36_00230 [Candidatus Methanoperedenaceae archaeon HGW-Methanoperedenaceae-1]